MEFSDVVGRRRMVRAFTPEPVDAEILDQMLSDALKAPSAGNSQGRDMVVLEGPEQTSTFWDVTLPPPRRSSFAWPGLLAAPVIVVPLADPQRYLDRYSQPDKEPSGLGASEDAWPVPYWTIDTAFATMTLLHAAVDAGLGALFFGIFRNEAELMGALGVPGHLRPIGAVAIGHPAPENRRGRSADRPRRGIADAVHRGSWGGARGR